MQFEFHSHTPIYRNQNGEIMTVSIQLPTEFKFYYENILKETPERGTIKLIIKDFKRCLREYKLIDKNLRKKYGTDFKNFKESEIVKKAQYSFEVEEDYCDWELALDGIETMKKEIQKLEKYL